MEDKKQKILIVDDDQLLLNIYTQKFAKGGFEVTVSTKGEEALEKLRGGFVPDILIIDVIMPSLDGFELLEKVKKEKLAEKAVVVMLTNQEQKIGVNEANKIGVDGYIIKADTTPSEVLEKVMEIHKNSFKNKNE